MALLKFIDVGINAIAACVPSKVMSNQDLTYLIPEDEIEKTINSIGIRERRFAEADVCSSDLCYKAAQKLLKDGNIDPETIDGLIFLSQTPDYRQPATSPSLQYRLGLKKSCLAFDVNLACSGYIYGLSIAYSFLSQIGINRILLLVGETMSKTISLKDKVTTPLFGDAGTATLIEKGNYGDSFFSLNSDGEGSNVLQVPYGGYRNPSCIAGFLEQPDKDNNFLNGEQLHMDGMDVFNFGIRVVPTDIRAILQFSGNSIDQIGVLVFHQANKFMTDFFAKRLKISSSKTPYSLDKYGNTSSASIPLTIVSEMFNKSSFSERSKVLLTGFGAGLSWGSTIINLEKAVISELIEF